tara:strand:+ start:793 stop:1071 length:279 start_codon:yes stop_codon:yes gene_type:complete
MASYFKTKQTERILFNIRIEVDMSPEFLNKFQLEESGNTYVSHSWFDKKSNATVFQDKGNMELYHQIANKCFRNNARRVHYVKAEKMEDDGV